MDETRKTTAILDPRPRRHTRRPVPDVAPPAPTRNGGITISAVWIDEATEADMEIWAAITKKDR